MKSFRLSIWTCSVLLLATGGRAWAQPPGGADVRPWYERLLVGMEVGPTGAQWGYSDAGDARYCRQFDGHEIVRQARAANSEYLVIWARDGDYAYYNSALLPKAPGLGERDPLRETLDEARPHGLPVIAYCVVQQAGHYLNQHPQYAMRGVDGQPLGRFCYNSGYLAAMQQIVAEQLAYGIDGFHIDMVDQGFGPPYGCWCDHCRSQFEKEYGHALPSGVTWDAAWDDLLEFRYRTSERFEQALYRHIKSLNPRASVDFNYHGNPPFSFEVGQRPVQHAANGDFITGETGVWGFSALTVGLNAEFYRAAVPGQRVQVAMQRGVRMYHDQTTRPLADIRWELFTLLAHGAFVTMVDKTGFDGWLDPAAYERIGAAFAEVRAKQEHFGHQPLAEVGLYFSHRTRDWHGRENPGKYFQSFQGAHKAIVYEHIPYGVVLDENVSLETLQRFRLVILPGAAIVSDAEAALLRQYVAQGGGLIVTGWSGALDRAGQPAETSSLAELIGGKRLRLLDTEDNWVRLPKAASADGASAAERTAITDDHLLADGIRRDWPFLVKGPAVVYEPGTARPCGELLKPHRTARQQRGEEGTDWPMSADAPVGPAMLVNRVGQGTVVTLACSPDFATASEHAVVEARRLLINAVRLLHPRPVLRISAPAHVEVVVTHDETQRTWRVHLLGYNSPPQTTPPRNRPYVLPALIEEPPLYRMRIIADWPIRQATSLSSATLLRHQVHEVEATVHDVHEALILTY